MRVITGTNDKFQMEAMQHSSSGIFVGEITIHDGQNKNRLSSTTCGEELQKIFQRLAKFKRTWSKSPQKS